MENSKWFLLIGGYFHEPQSQVATFATIEEAQASVTEVTCTYSKYIDRHYMILGARYDYFEIIDLRDYVFGETNHESGCHKIEI
jgi:hypothetical protein